MVLVAISEETVKEDRVEQVAKNVGREGEVWEAGLGARVGA